MGIFRQFPYTNFHDLNLDWILGRVKELWKGVGDIEEKVDNFIADTEPTIRDEVDKWLDEHPEATTTVQDHSLTEIKFTDELANKTIKDYVTPQMFGAKGDGVNDDTNAFKSAINSGKSILVPGGIYNISEYLFSDDSIVFKDDGSYNNKKFIISKKITDIGVTCARQNTKYFANTGLIGLQSVVFNNVRNTLVLGSASSTANKPAIVEVDPDTFNVIRTLPSDLFNHCNDMTFNENTSSYYIAPMDGNKIIVVDADMFVIKQTLEIDNLTDVYQISYDPDNDIYYLSDQNDVYIYDSNFIRIKGTGIKPVATGFKNNPYSNLALTTSQGSCVYKGQFLTMEYSLGNTGFSSICRISQFNLADTSKVKYQFDVKMLTSFDEPESIVVMNDMIYLFGYTQESITCVIIDPTSDGIDVSNEISVFSQGTNGTHVGINFIRITNNNDVGIYHIGCRTIQALSAGSSYYCNISNMGSQQGIGIGYYADAMIMVILANGTLNIRPFKNLPENITFNIQGFFTNANVIQ